MPVRVVEAAFALVFEKFIDWCEQQAGALRRNANIEIEFVVQEINVAIAEHREPSAGDFEIVGMKHAILCREGRLRLASNAVADDFARQKRAQYSGQRTE